MATPLGTIDLTKKDIMIRNYIFDKAKEVLDKRNVTQIETPVIELLSTVEALYGNEFTKLVYNLTDEGQKLILRYDLTVPLARFIGANGLVKFRRFQYGKVYRRDHPQIEKGRYREFYQFDYDIIGDDQKSGCNDLEMIETMNKLLSSILGDGTFVIKINHKDVVIDILRSLNISESLYQAVFSAIDKLDKKTFCEIKEELSQKGLSDEQILNLEKMYEELNKSNNMDETFDVLKEKNLLSENSENYLKLVKNFLKKSNITCFQLYPFLVRGMDYYTGLIYEAMYIDKTIIETTISSGGRYDNMIGNFSNKGNIPAIGMSLGVERIVKILSKTIFKDETHENNITVFVASIGKNMICDRVVLCSEIRNMGFKTVMSDLANPTMRLQFDSVFNENIPVMIIIGQTEIENGTVNIKNVKKNIQETIERKPEVLLQKIKEILEQQ